jgi:hypothetical protein
MTWPKQITTPKTSLRCSRNVFTELLPGNGRAIHRKTHTQIIVWYNTDHIKKLVGRFVYCCMYSLPRECVYRAVSQHQKEATIGDMYVQTHGLMRGFTKCVAEIGSAAMTYMTSFIKISSSIQKLLGKDTRTDRHYGYRITLLLESRLKTKLLVHNEEHYASAVIK